MAGFGAFLTHVFFSLLQEEEKNLKKNFSTSIIFDFISNYTNYIHIKTHGSVSCGPRSRRVAPVSILTGRKKTQFSHLRSSVLP